MELFNNLTELIMNAVKNLQILRRLYPTFTMKINLLKAYLYSSIMYQSSILTISNDQTILFKRIIKWFLYDVKSDGKKLPPFNILKKKYTVKVSLDRLSFPKKKGGKSLHDIQNVFSASKCKFLIDFMNDRNSQKTVYLLLKEELYFFQPTKTK